MAGQPGLFDLDERYAALSRTGDPLERLAAVVDFEIFRADLDAALARSDRSKGGRPPMDAVMMFKVLVLQALYGLADEQTEFQVRDRLSFMRFLGLDLHGRVPDARTIWLFRELLTKARPLRRSAKIPGPRDPGTLNVLPKSAGPVARRRPSVQVNLEHRKIEVSDCLGYN
jgi:Transposase domain (DUF772)